MYKCLTYSSPVTRQKFILDKSFKLCINWYARVTLIKIFVVVTGVSASTSRVLVKEF